MPLAEEVKAEAIKAGQRRALARSTGRAARMPRGPDGRHYPWGDRIRAISEALDAEAERERRLASLRRIRSPSALIARMKKDWPALSKVVVRYAEAEGLELGEAWAKLIRRAVGGLRKRRR